MKNLKLGLQMHAVREDFLADPAGTLKQVAEMGYQGVEFNYPALDRSAQEYKAALDACGLECYGTLVSWVDLQPDVLPKTMQYHKDLGTDKLIVGSVPPDVLNAEPDAPKKAVEYMNELYNILSEAGFMTGYHNHDSDFTICYDGKTFYEYVMNNTPKGFLMVLDTGNAVAGGGVPLELIKKYPGRTPIMHIKGYSQAQGYVTPVWQADIDWDAVIAAAVELGGAEYLDIEFGKRGEYVPLERAAASAKWLAEQVNK